MNTKNGKKRTVGIILSAVMGLIFVSAQAGAAEFGRFELYPELNIEGVYRSNLWLTETQQKSDLVTTTRPGFRLVYGFGPHSLNVGYNVGFVNYASNSGDNYQDHRANGALKLKFPGGLDVNIDNFYINSVLERTAVVGVPRYYEQNNFNPSLAYTFADRWKIKGNFIQEDKSLRSDTFRTEAYSQHTYGASLFYRFLPRTAGLIEYDRVVKDFKFSDGSDSRAHLVYTGLSFDPEGKLSGELKAGYEWKQYVHDITTRNNKPDSWIAAMGVTQRFSPQTVLNFGAMRQLSDDIDVGNASYAITTATLSLQHYFMTKIAGRASAGYYQGDYLDETTEPVTGILKKRTDKRWTLGAGLAYDIQKWFQTWLEYRYEDKDSNFRTFSYTDHRVIFSLRFAL